MTRRDDTPAVTQATLLEELRRHIGDMLPHQHERPAGKLLVRAGLAIARSEALRRQWLDAAAKASSPDRAGALRWCAAQLGEALK